ncbi:MAG: DUF3634 family protein [Polyangiaceae bacterium]|nr:DUF3634 family protein [Polyangiaceae bacterium]
MWSLLIPLALMAASIPLVLALVRANELFYVRVEGKRGPGRGAPDGDPEPRRPNRVRLVRGRAPQRLLDDITDVLQAEPIDRGAVRVVVEDRRARVYVEGGVSAAQGQRLKNVVSMWPVPKIRNAPRRR